ncbi:MAG: hypothetical protein WCJ94_00860 [bacterium]
MKNKTIWLFLIIICAFIFAFIFLIFKKTNPSYNIIKTGSAYSDFIIGMKDNTVYKLRDIVGKRFAVLTFLDSSEASSKLSELVANNISAITLTKPNLFWLNITKDQDHAEISELTSILKIRYRTLYSNIPKEYFFQSNPVVLIIDSKGIIQYIYIGYSPTIINDMQNWLSAAK